MMIFRQLQLCKSLSTVKGNFSIMGIRTDTCVHPLLYINILAEICSDGKQGFLEIVLHPWEGEGGTSPNFGKLGSARDKILDTIGSKVL